MRMRKLCILVLVCLLAALVVQAADDAQAKPTRPTSETKSAEPAAASGGMIAVKDAVTGEFRQATVEEIQALLEGTMTNAVRVSVPPTNVRYGPGKAVGVSLDASTQSYMVATKGTDGKVKVDCLSSTGAAQKLAAASGALGTTTKEAPNAR